jgi:hypothetical protein
MSNKETISAYLTRNLNKANTQIQLMKDRNYQMIANAKGEDSLQSKSIAHWNSLKETNTTLLNTLSQVQLSTLIKK